MDAKVTHRFYGAEDGTIYPRWHEVGDIVKGDLAHCAIEQGDAVPAKKREPIVPDHQKTLSVSQPAPVLPKKTAPKRRGRPPKSSS